MIKNYNHTIHINTDKDDPLRKNTIQIIDNETGIHEYLEATDEMGSKEIAESITILIDAIEQKVEAYKEMKKNTKGITIPFQLIHKAAEFNDGKKLTEYVRKKAEERHKQDRRYTADEYFFAYAEALRTQRIIARLSI